MKLTKAVTQRQILKAIDLAAVVAPAPVSADPFTSIDSTSDVLARGASRDLVTLAGGGRVAIVSGCSGASRDDCRVLPRLHDRPTRPSPITGRRRERRHPELPN